MKAASADLIVLMTNAKDVVYWDVFTITLADGTKLTYSTRDADAPTLAVPASALLDTFTRRPGTLLTHVGEAGADWASANSRETCESYFAEDGVLRGVAPGELVASWNVPVEPASLWMAADVNLLDNTGNFVELVLTFRDADFTSSASVDFTLDTGANGRVVFASSSIAGVNSTFNQSAYVETNIPGSTAFTAEIRLTENRTQVDVLLNGVAVPELTVAMEPGDQMAADLVAVFSPRYIESYEVSGGQL